MEKTIDIKFSELCDEIDYWKSESIMWEEKYLEMRDELYENYDRSTKHSNDMIGTVLSNLLKPIKIG